MCNPEVLEALRSKNCSKIGFFWEGCHAMQYINLHESILTQLPNDSNRIQNVQQVLKVIATQRHVTSQ